MNAGRLKNRRFVSLDADNKTIAYLDAEDVEHTARYDQGEVKLDWRLDWPGRWWLLKVAVEPFGRDHATKGGSYDTGVAIMKDIYQAAPPIPVPYDFVNRAGDTKKMSASKGTGIYAHEAARVMPAEVLRFFMLRFPASKRLYFDSQDGVVRLVDEFAALAAKTDRSESEQQLYYLCTNGLDKQTVSRVPFSHLVASYQASLKNPDLTIEVIKRSEYHSIAVEDAEIIREELQFIDQWLVHWAPEDVKFSLSDTFDAGSFSESQKRFLELLADKITDAPEDADGSWFHLAMYELKDELGINPKDMFATLYSVLLGRSSGPRAGWFLSVLPRDWLLDRLRLVK
jgi:lysyl-tRNA synthetase class 1